MKVIKKTEPSLVKKSVDKEPELEPKTEPEEPKSFKREGVYPRFTTGIGSSGLRGAGTYGGFAGIQIEKRTNGGLERSRISIQDMPSSVRDSETFMNLTKKVNDAIDKAGAGQGPQQTMTSHIAEADILSYIMSAEDPEAALREYEMSIGK